MTTTAPCCSTSMFSGSIALAHPLTWHVENSCSRQLMNMTALGASKCFETGSTKFCSCIITKKDILFHLIRRIYNPLLVRLCELGKCLFRSYFPVAFYLHSLLDAYSSFRPQVIIYVFLPHFPIYMQHVLLYDGL